MLGDLRIVEIGEGMAVQVAGLMLAELGADVLKVERPGGDPDAAGMESQIMADRRRAEAAQAVRAGIALPGPGLGLALAQTAVFAAVGVVDVVAEAQVPMVSMAASARIVEPVDAKKRWVFKTPQSDIQMALAIASHMADAGVRNDTVTAWIAATGFGERAFLMFFFAAFAAAAALAFALYARRYPMQDFYRT